jgi:predicted RNA-binding Zn-ribbon protein involved in translation (DUF1610 family)
MENVRSKSRGPWLHRFAVGAFTILLGLLVYWLLGFIVEDIRSIRGPVYEEIEKKTLDHALVEKRDALDKRIVDLSRQIDQQNAKKQLLGDSTQSLQQTINQLLEMQKLSLQKNLALSEPQQANFTSSLNLFLENQKKAQDLYQMIAQLMDERTAREEEKQQIEQALDDQRQPAREKFQRLEQRHNLKLGAFQLAILIPLLAVAMVLLVRKRRSIYVPLIYAFGVAILVKVGMVMHEYFPTWAFKYILILVLVAAIARLLIAQIRISARPKAPWLIKQYRDAYTHFLCPNCEYPIRTGPRKFLFWTRRTAGKVAPRGEEAAAETVYTCPECGTRLFEECGACHKIRHTLLPFCAHCGAKHTVPEG